MINISSRDFDLTEAIKTEVNGVGEFIFDHMGREEKVDIVLSKTSPTTFKVNIQAHYKGEDIVSNHESHNFHKALDLCKDHFLKLVDKKRGIQSSKRR